jgi:hypothetical protein
MFIRHYIPPIVYAHTRLLVASSSPLELLFPTAIAIKAAPRVMSFLLIIVYIFNIYFRGDVCLYYALALKPTATAVHSR